MVVLKFILLAVYAVSVITFCVSTLCDIKSTKRPKTYLAWYGAIILPLVSTFGGFAHYFDWSISPTAWYICLSIWLSAWLAFFLELRDLEDHDTPVTVVTVLSGLFLIGLFFGPGLFLTGAWLFQRA